MRQPSNLPPGVTDRMIEDFQEPNESKHTPGPYIARPYRLGGRLYIAITHTDDNGKVRDIATVSGGNAEANARFIAAAPEAAAERDRLREINRQLVEACEALLNNRGAIEAIGYGPITPETPEGMPKDSD